MRLPWAVICTTSLLLAAHGQALGQRVAPTRTSGTDVDNLKKEIDLLKREIDLLKRENELLKRENEVLKKGGTAKTTEGEPSAGTRVTADDVEYAYQGTTRSGSTLLVTILATSQDGNKAGPNGAMVLIDDRGTRYTGRPTTGFGAQPVLREGVPVKLTWVFGAPNAFTGGVGAGAPSTKITRFAAVVIHRTVANTETDTIDFRNVPATITKSKSR